MQSLAAISMLIITVVTVTVGARLLLVARRTRMLPELLFAVAFLGSGLGQAFGQLGMRLIWNDAGEVTTAMNTLCFGGVVIGNLALWLATWRIYRAGDKLAMAFCGLGSVVAVLAFGMRILDGDFVTASPDTRGFALHMGTRAALLAWTSFESFRYYGLLRRRLALGLAEPMVTNQILLWGISAAATLFSALLISTSVFVLGRHPLEVPAVVVMLLVAVSVIASCMWCAFFPPGWLRRRVEARSVAAA